MDNNYNIWGLLWNSIRISMTQEEIQQIVDYAYPKIINYYGKGSKPIPPAELHFDIYARLIGINDIERE